ncbi:hypothetical protein DSO57_1033352 [Entomophthora muscae]|uniref:Uncharacterized protein n=1 Tax=Entomophthora muscae TaxID=34485 RepID=A0ACC2SCS5_9FUNG|nr:hypothetical protein DSO57_1033352 [Entomophthora muscae]
MTPPLTPQPDRLMETPTAAEIMSTQFFGVLYITLKGMVDSMMPTSGPWSLLGQSMSYIIKLVPILWWALPAVLAQPHPKPTNTSTYAWFPERRSHSRIYQKWVRLMQLFASASQWSIPSLTCWRTLGARYQNWLLQMQQP